MNIFLFACSFALFAFVASITEVFACAVAPSARYFGRHRRLRNLAPFAGGGFIEWLSRIGRFGVFSDSIPGRHAHDYVAIRSVTPFVSTPRTRQVNANIVLSKAECL